MTLIINQVKPQRSIQL